MADSPAQDTQPAAARTRERALLLPLLGAVLLLPPVAGIFQLDVRIAGIPFTAVYLFVAWGALIVGAARLARGLRQLEPRPPDPGEGDQAPD